jgi:hypothetical protein
MRVRLVVWLSVFGLGTLSASTTLAQPPSSESAVAPSVEVPVGSDVPPTFTSALDEVLTFGSDVAPTFSPTVPPNFTALPEMEPAPDMSPAAGGAWRVNLFAVPAAVAPAPVVVSSEMLTLLADAQAAQRPRPVAFEYSEGYQKRKKIHVYASLAMLPLFVTQFALGNSLWDDSTEGKKTAHVVVGSSIGVLFGLNTVTGVWNLWEGRKNPEGRARRLTHGLMMLGADAGFFATALLAPGDDGSGDRDTHRAVALTSIGVATASYLFMLLTR